MKYLKKEDPRITENEIRDNSNLSSRSFNPTLRHHLGVWRHCARGVHKQLTEEQRRGREWCLHVLRKYDRGRSERVSDIVTGSEAFVSSYDKEAKQQSSVWVFPGESPPVKFKKSRSTSKKIIALFAKFGHVTSNPLQERKRGDAEWYSNIRLPKVFEAWTARRPNDGTLSLLLHHDNESSHTAFATLDYLEANRVQLVIQTLSSRV